MTGANAFRWKCSHDFKVEFPLDIKLLKTVLHFIAESHADCKVDVDFTLADSGEAETALLDSAAKNARKKAETLCAAIGAKLGSLVRIDYNWGEINIYSHTKYDSGIFSSNLFKEGGGRDSPRKNASVNAVPSSYSS